MKARTRKLARGSLTSDENFTKRDCSAPKDCAGWRSGEYCILARTVSARRRASRRGQPSHERNQTLTRSVQPLRRGHRIPRRADWDHATMSLLPERDRARVGNSSASVCCSGPHHCFYYYRGGDPPGRANRLLLRATQNAVIG